MFERFNGNVVPFADESTSTNRTVFGSETQSDDIDDNLNADFKKGWEIVGLNDNPTREDFNAMGYTLGYLTSYLYQNGVAEYNLLQEYKANSIAIGTDGNIYQSLVDNNLGNALTDTTKWVCIASKNSIVNSIAELKTISNIESINVLGYYEKGDGGGGIFYWDSTSTEDDNGGTIIQATGVTTGRWKRVFSGAINVKWFGAKGDGATDDSQSFQNAIDYSISSGKYEPVYLNGVFVIYETIRYDGYVSLIGEHNAQSGNTTQILCYNPNCTLDIGFYNANPFSLSFLIQNISFKQMAGFVGDKSSIIYINSVSSFEMKNCQFYGVGENPSGTAITMANTSNNMDLIKLTGMHFYLFENGIWLNRLDNSQSFSGHIYEFSGSHCKYYLRLSGGACFYNGSILANHITYNGNTENIIYIERGNLTNSDVSIYAESTSDVDLDGCVINLGSYIENNITGNINVAVGGDGFTDHITNRQVLQSNTDIIGFSDFYALMNYPNPTSMITNNHSSKRVQSLGVNTQKILNLNNGYIQNNYYPDDIISNKVGSTTTLLKNISPLVDTQSTIKSIKGYGRVKQFTQATGEVLKFNTIDLFPNYNATTKTIPSGTIWMRVTRSQLLTSRIIQTLLSSSDTDNNSFRLLFNTCYDYSEMRFQTDKSLPSVNHSSPKNWRLPFEREIIFCVKWNESKTFVYWDGYKVSYNETPKFGNFLYFGNSYSVNNQSFGGSVYDIAVWGSEVRSSIVESFYLNNTYWS